MGIKNHRKEVLNCHLPYMEIYEKLFVFLNIFLVILLILDCAAVLFLLAIACPGLEKIFLNKTLKSKEINSAKIFLCIQLKIGDLIILKLISDMIGSNQFGKVLIELYEKRLCKVNDYTEVSFLIFFFKI